MMRLYLAGPINGCTDAEARGWRDAVTAAIGDRYEILNPMDRDYRGREHADPLALVDADLLDIARADWMVVNAERPTWGTGMEIPHAVRLSTRVLVWCPAPVPSPWLVYHATKLVPTLGDAITYLVERAA